MTPRTITASLGALADAEPALERLAGEKLPFQTAYRVAKLKRAVAEETRHFYEQRNALVREHGQARPGGGPDDVHVLPTMPSWPTFVAKVTELAAVQATIPLWPLDLTTVPGLTIAPSDVLLLEPLILDGVEPASKP
jgi:hypothetical protein